MGSDDFGCICTFQKCVESQNVCRGAMYDQILVIFFQLRSGHLHFLLIVSNNDCHCILELGVGERDGFLIQTCEECG